MFRSLQLHEMDNVSIAVVDCPSNETIAVEAPSHKPSFTVLSIQAIQFGHKIAIQEIKPGDIVTKYGRPIGRATAHILTGGLVGVHNMEGLRGRGDLSPVGGEANGILGICSSWR